jgi:hypothetical protein
MIHHRDGYSSFGFRVIIVVVVVVVVVVVIVVVVVVVVVVIMAYLTRLLLLPLFATPDLFHTDHCRHAHSFDGQQRFQHFFPGRVVLKHHCTI